MQIILAFFRLVRGVNLLFIALTQYLFQYCIIVPITLRANQSPVLNDLNFSLIVVASILIAAGGNVINDYFDINIDTINKPTRKVIDTVIGRRWAIFWHLFLSIIGIICTFYVAIDTGSSFWIVFLNILAFLLLWTYSSTFKKKFLSGNIIIAILTSWVILILNSFEMQKSFNAVLLPGTPPEYGIKIVKLSIVYAGFAFIISLIREVVKDVEDWQGDLKYGCRTMPIVLGLQGTKVFMITWTVVLLGSISIIQLYTLSFKWWNAISYTFFFVIIPLIVVIFKLQHAKEKKDFHALSFWIKGIMLTGILSMIFFKLYV